MMAMDNPKAFGELMDKVTRTDCARTELAASTPGVDMVVERGWYSSTDFWSPKLFDEFVYPRIRELAGIAHKQVHSSSGRCPFPRHAMGRGRAVAQGVEGNFITFPLRYSLILLNTEILRKIQEILIYVS